MTIETKYNIGDEVWVMAWPPPQRCRVSKIRIESYNFGVAEEFYTLIGKGVYPRYRDEIFRTKEELLKSL